jgi:hypothetical protein
VDLGVFPDRPLCVASGPLFRHEKGISDMKLNMAVATTLAGLLLVGGYAGRAHAGWFGFGDSSKSTEASKTPKTEFYNPDKIASGPSKAASSSKSSSGGIAGLFGAGKQQSNKQATTKKPVSSGTKSKKGDKNDSSWWNSLFKPKDPPPPKSTREWMKLPPVRY